MIVTVFPSLEPNKTDKSKDTIECAYIEVLTFWKSYLKSTIIVLAVLGTLKAIELFRIISHFDYPYFGKIKQMCTINLTLNYHDEHLHT